MKITHATCTALNIPFYCKRVTAAMHRANTHGERIYLYRVETDNGLVGYGDSEHGDAVDSLVGKNPYAILHDDRIGYGAQLAVLDVAGKDAGVPAHALIGTKLRGRCPISWWDIDMSPADWAAEARESIKRGYTCFKTKARPWRDIFAQVEAVGRAVPADYKLDVDFNGHLRNAANAEIVLSELDDHPNVGIYESPFYLRDDLEGARILRSRTRKLVVDHFNNDVLHAHASDGFVISGGISVIREQGTLAAEFNKPFWLQLVGTGITTAFAAHIGSVLSHAQLPHITCSELWAHDLLKKKIPVTDGYMPVPDRPGLGIEVDEKAIAKFAVDAGEPTPKQRYSGRKRILRIIWPGAQKKPRVWEFTNEEAYQELSFSGGLPGFQRGITLEVEEDDGTKAFRKHHRRLADRGL